jgi:4-hydroxyphenylpyruvate dioxygenase
LDRRSDGLVYSQAVETADGALRFTLNGSMAVQSLSSRFIQAYFGAGVQHIAFATDDVFTAACRRCGSADAGYRPQLLRGSGGESLDPELLARMERLNILYDRDGQGENASECLVLHPRCGQAGVF